MAFTYDVTTQLGQVRLLAVDTTSTDYIFEDEEIDTFLTLESSSVWRAAALALETIANNEALVQKVLTSLDVSTNGAAVANSLRMGARDLRARSKEAESREEGGAFDIAEQVFDQFTRRERWWNQVQRNDAGS